ncbi:mobilization protein [Adlercreutzia sp. ZJ473]|uniref:plasmid mobilization protein n=1 Tax=Adlercreutzia sp. ZJ473 TaxID=2722822 RepID=UPI00352FF853
MAVPCKNENRARPITIAFRLSKEMNETVNLLVAASGMTKQDYILSKLVDREIIVKASPSMYMSLRDELREVCKQLNRLRKGENPSEHLLETCDLLGEIVLGLRGDDTQADAEREDDILKRMGRC